MLLESFFSFFYLRDFESFLILTSLNLLRLCEQDAIMLILSIVLILLLCIEDQRIEKEDNCNTFALSKR